MQRRIALATLLVRDYDEALAFFTGALGFAAGEDEPLDDAAKRWVTVLPPGGGAGLLLARAEGEEQRAVVGRQAAGRVAFSERTTSRATTRPSWPPACASPNSRAASPTARSRSSPISTATCGT